MDCIESIRGKKLLIVDGFEHRYDRTSSDGLKKFYRCTFAGCKGRVHADESDENGVVVVPHSHLPAIRRTSERSHRRQQKRTARSSNDCPREIKSVKRTQDRQETVVPGPSFEADLQKMSVKARIGEPAPAFTVDAVVNGRFETISLSQYSGKWVVLFFYPLDFTFVCPTEIIAFSDRFEEFKKLNVQLIAASTDSKFSHLAWIEKPRKEGGLGKMNIPVIEDTNHNISRAYGVLKEDAGVAFRGLFIIDPHGILRQITINDMPVGRSVDETLRLVQAFQFVEEHGEVCPAGWHPGAATIKPDVDGSKEFFKKC